MYILDDVPLNAYSTMKLGGKAAHLCDINDQNEIPKAIAWAEDKKLPIIMIGGGSNIIWSDEGFAGLVLVNKINSYELTENDTSAYLTVGAGEVWDFVVERSVTNGYSGLELLSFIPGTAGATPIQNVGAYGKEISDVLTTVQAYDKQTKQFVTIPASDCDFGYRTSRFKTTDKNRYFISSVGFMLTRSNPEPPFYATLQTYLTEHKITTYTPQIIRDAVIAVRQSKLPDPQTVANNGSFFANPIISQQILLDLQNRFPDIQHWTNDDGTVKLSAGWLIENAGYKDAHDEALGMATWSKQANVLVNEHAKTTADLLSFKQRIVNGVKQKFGVELLQEPELIS